MLTPRVQAGTKVSPEISVKAASPAEGSTNSSPFKENTENEMNNLLDNALLRQNTGINAKFLVHAYKSSAMHFAKVQISK